MEEDVERERQQESLQRVKKLGVKKERANKSSKRKWQ